MKYFLHDSNSFNDEKISELFMHFGYEGLGLFYTALEKIAAQEKPIKTDVLKAQLKVGKKLTKCWNFMETLGILSSNNGETFNKQLLNYAESYKIKKEKTAERISEWRKNQELTKNVTRSEQVSNTSKVKVYKVKVYKGIKEDKESLSAFDTIFNKFFEYRKEIKKPIKDVSIELAKKTLHELSGGSIELAEKIVNRSIANSWQGLFELDKNNNTNGKQQKPRGIHADDGTFIPESDIDFSKLGKSR